jgi:hypothetical protein
LSTEGRGGGYLSLDFRMVFMYAVFKEFGNASAKLGELPSNVHSFPALPALAGGWLRLPGRRIFEEVTYPGSFDWTKKVCTKSQYGKEPAI